MYSSVICSGLQYSTSTSTTHRTDRDRRPTQSSCRLGVGVMSDPQRAPLPLGGGRHAKRAAMIARHKLHLLRCVPSRRHSWAVSQDEPASPDDAPRPPDPWDVSISKRQWEWKAWEWRQALRQWRKQQPCGRGVAGNVVASQGELQESLPEPLYQWGCKPRRIAGTLARARAE